MKHTKTYKLTPALEHPDVKETSRLVEYGHGAFGERDNIYVDEYYFIIKNNKIYVDKHHYVISDENNNIIGVIHEISLPDPIRLDIDDDYKKEKEENDRRIYESLKKKYEIKLI